MSSKSARTLCRDMPIRYKDFPDHSLGERIYKIFNTSTGFFLDIGAAHPWVMNNTKYLEDNGWDGICVEPNINFVQLLEQYRQCRVVRAAIWEEDGEAAFNTGEMGSALVATGQQCGACFNWRDSVKIMRMETFLNDNSDIIPKQIQYISVDAQYSEHTFYRDLPLAKVISMEIHREEWKREIIDYFSSKGYSIEHLSHGDYLFIKKTFEERIKEWLVKFGASVSGGLQVGGKALLQWIGRFNLKGKDSRRNT